MEQERQDQLQRPLGAKRAHLIFIGVLLFMACYAALTLGLLQ